MNVNVKTNVAKFGIAVLGLILGCIALNYLHWWLALLVGVGFGLVYVSIHDVFLKEDGQAYDSKMVRLATLGLVILSLALVGEIVNLVSDPPKRVVDVAPKIPHEKIDTKQGNAKVPTSMLPVAPWPSPTTVETPPPVAPAPPVAAPPATQPFIQIVPPPVAPDPVPAAAPAAQTRPRVLPKPNTAPVHPKSLPAPKAKQKSSSNDDSDSKSKDDTPKHPSWSYTPEKSGSSDRGDENRVTIEDPVLPNN